MLRRLIFDDGGQDLIEYTLLSALIGIVGILAWTNVGSAINTTYAVGHGRAGPIGHDAGPDRRRIVTPRRDEHIMNSFHIIVVGVALVAAGWDVATRRIPNVLTFGAALAALVVHGYVGGWSGAGMAAAGWAAGVALFFPVFALGGMGAGDVKLLGAVGAWLGPVAAVWVALYSGIAGGVMGLLVAGFSGYLARHSRTCGAC